MKQNEYYSTNKFNYPQKKDFDTYFLYKRGEVLLKNGTLIEVESVIRSREKDDPNLERLIMMGVHILAEKGGYIIERAHDDVRYDTALANYRNENARLHKEFEDDLYEEYGVQNEPGRHVMFAYAWQEGHSSGFGNVASVFSEIVELVEKIDLERKVQAKA